MDYKIRFVKEDGRCLLSNGRAVMCDDGEWVDIESKHGEYQAYTPVCRGNDIVGFDYKCTYYTSAKYWARKILGTAVGVMGLLGVVLAIASVPSGLNSMELGALGVVITLGSLGILWKMNI